MHRRRGTTGAKRALGSLCGNPLGCSKLYFERSMRLPGVVWSHSQQNPWTPAIIEHETIFSNTKDSDLYRVILLKRINENHILCHNVDQTPLVTFKSNEQYYCFVLLRLVSYSSHASEMLSQSVRQSSDCCSFRSFGSRSG